MCGLFWKLTICCFSWNIVLSQVPPCGISIYDDAGELTTVQPHITGGVEARPGELPWQVSVLERNFHVCGAVLLSKNWVITAAHCVSDLSGSYTLVFGEHDRFASSPVEFERPVDVANIHIHEQYSGSTEENDIALIFVDSVGNFTDFVRPVCLPDEILQYEGMSCVVSGWGILADYDDKADILHYTQLDVISNQQCSDMYSGLLNVFESNLCATYAPQGRGACTGDSGGPLVCNVNDTFHLIGVVSRGMGCGDPAYPGVYSDVVYYLDWIAGIMQTQK